MSLALASLLPPAGPPPTIGALEIALFVRITARDVETSSMGHVGEAWRRRYREARHRG